MLSSRARAACERVNEMRRRREREKSTKSTQLTHWPHDVMRVTNSNQRISQLNIKSLSWLFFVRRFFYFSLSFPLSHAVPRWRRRIFDRNGHRMSRLDFFALKNKNNKRLSSRWILWATWKRPIWSGVCLISFHLILASLSQTLSATAFRAE